MGRWWWRSHQIQYTHKKKEAAAAAEKKHRTKQGMARANFVSSPGLCYTLSFSIKFETNGQLSTKIYIPFIIMVVVQLFISSWPFFFARLLLFVRKLS